MSYLGTGHTREGIDGYENNAPMTRIIIFEGP
jgi:hypothetical protein